MFVVGSNFGVTDKGNIVANGGLIGGGINISAEGLAAGG